MPLWARSLSAATCGAGAFLGALVLAAAWWVPYPLFWSDLWQFAVTPSFWRLAGAAWLLAAAALLLAGAGAGRRRHPPVAPGLAAGAALALAYATYVAARHHLPLAGAAPEAMLLAGGAGLAGALATWVFHRL